MADHGVHRAHGADAGAWSEVNVQDQPGHGAKPPKKTNPLLIVAVVLGGVFLIGVASRSQEPAESASGATDAATRSRSVTTPTEPEPRSGPTEPAAATPPTVPEMRALLAELKALEQDGRAMEAVRDNGSQCGDRMRQNQAKAHELARRAQNTPPTMELQAAARLMDLCVSCARDSALEWCGRVHESLQAAEAELAKAKR